MTLIRRIPTVFTNPAGPKLRLKPPSVGVNDYSYRYIPNRLEAATGSAVAEVANEGTTVAPLAQATSGARPTLRRNASDAWLEFDGTDDFLRVAVSINQPLSFAMIARVRLASGAKTALRMDGAGGLQAVASASAWDVRPAAGSGMAAGIPGLTLGTDNAWHFLAGYFTGSGKGARAIYDGTVSGEAGNAPTTFPSASMLSLGDSGAGVGFTNYDVAELIVWPRALGDNEMSTVRTRLKTSHPSLGLA